MAKPGDRDVTAGRSGQARGAGANSAHPDAAETGRSRWGITRVSDEDYRCVWRPCLALEEEEGGETS